MAKSQRSNKKKALRTQRAARASHVLAQAEAKRMEALAKCMAADPLPVVNSAPSDASDEQQLQQQRGRDGGTAAMAVDGEQQQQQQGAARKQKKGKRGIKVGAGSGAGGAGVAKRAGKPGGGKKRKGAQALLARQFSKPQKKMRR